MKIIMSVVGEEGKKTSKLDKLNEEYFNKVVAIRKGKYIDITFTDDFNSK